LLSFIKKFAVSKTHRAHGAKRIAISSKDKASFAKRVKKFSLIGFLFLSLYLF